MASPSSQPDDLKLLLRFTSDSVPRYHLGGSLGIALQNFDRIHGTLISNPYSRKAGWLNQRLQKTMRLCLTKKIQSPCHYFLRPVLTPFKIYELHAPLQTESYGVTSTQVHSGAVSSIAALIGSSMQHPAVIPTSWTKRFTFSILMIPTPFRFFIISVRSAPEGSATFTHRIYGATTCASIILLSLPKDAPD